MFIVEYYRVTEENKYFTVLGSYDTYEIAHAAMEDEKAGDEFVGDNNWRYRIVTMQILYEDKQ